MQDNVISIGIDQSFSRTGIVVFKGEQIVLTGSVYSHRRKNKVTKEEAHTLKGEAEFSESDHFSEILNSINIIIEFDKGEYIRICTYHKVLLEILTRVIGSLLTRYPGLAVHIGVEIPMGSHLGGGAKADRVYALTLLAIKDVVFKYNQVKVHTFFPSVIKSFVTGKGNAKKDLMLLDVYKKWNFETKYHDIADAFSIGKLIFHNLAEKDNNDG